MRIVLHPTVDVALGAATLFGGDDPLLGRPWYHQELTLEAARRAGWDPAPSEDLAWHAVQIDMYCFDPTWRYRTFTFPGPLRAWTARYAAVPRLRDPLSTLHFLDLFTPEAVAAFWHRLLTGTVAGLGWAAHDADVAAARLLTGLSLHAVQDFYAHSSWVNDPGRREVTWFRAGEEQRAAADLWSAGHFCGPPPGRASHGKIRRRTSSEEAAPARPPRVFGSRLLARFVELEPGGVTLDAPWMTGQTALARGLDAKDGPELFEAAYTLALRSSVQWLRALDAAMRAAGLATFWRDVRSARLPGTSRVAAFERPGAVAPLAAAAGAACGVPEGRDHDGSWFGFARLTWGSGQDDVRRPGVGRFGAGRRGPGGGCVVPLGPWPDRPDHVELRRARTRSRRAPAPVERAEVYLWQRPPLNGNRLEVPAGVVHDSRPDPVRRGTRLGRGPGTGSDSSSDKGPAERLHLGLDTGVLHPFVVDLRGFPQG